MLLIIFVNEAIHLNHFTSFIVSYELTVKFYLQKQRKVEEDDTEEEEEEDNEEETDVTFLSFIQELLINNISILMYVVWLFYLGHMTRSYNRQVIVPGNLLFASYHYPLSKDVIF